MYFPYLRGRQNELLCLRELLEAGKLGEKIVPIIEPVHFNGTLFSTLTKFIETRRSIIMITNPKVGTFNKEYQNTKIKIEKEMDVSKKEKMQKTLDSYVELLKNPFIQKAQIVDNDVVAKVVSDNKDISDIVMINLENGNYQYYEKYGEKLSAKITLIPRDEDFRDEVEGDAVVLENGYTKAKRNVDYKDSPDDFFSRNHVVYKKRGYIGFSDFSIVGDEFEESGFAPMAIAIHIIYFGNKDETRIHHFVSDSNDSPSDAARKFGEAMEKILGWEYFGTIPKTKGLCGLIDCFNMGKYPGLGMIKKYSLMHHMEMMGEYLEER